MEKKDWSSCSVLKVPLVGRGLSIKKKRGDHGACREKKWFIVPKMQYQEGRPDIVWGRVEAWKKSWLAIPLPA